MEDTVCRWHKKEWAERDPGDGSRRPDGCGGTLDGKGGTIV